jgi:hypothetical protein
MAEFPNAIKAFTDVVDGVDEVLANQVNQAYDEIEAIETQLVGYDFQTLGAQLVTYDTGWIPTTDSWSPTSDGTITIPAGGLSIYSPGDKIRYSKNGSSDFSYGYVITITDTLITPCAGADYSVATSDTITDISYSKSSTPTGFLQLFNLTAPVFTSTGTAFSNQPTIYSAKMEIIGKLCYLYLTGRGHATSGGTGRFILTFTAGQLPPVLGYPTGTCINATTAVPGFSSAEVGSDNVIKICKMDGTALFTNSEYFGANIWFPYTA